MSQEIPNRRVLMVTDEFPPQPGGRSEKMASRVKYLHQYGWSTVVLTPLPWKHLVDETLLSKMPTGLVVYRTGYFLRRLFPNLRRELAVHNESVDKWLDLLRVFRGFVRWIPYAVLGGWRLIGRYQIDVIYSMNNPVTNHLIAYILHKLTGKPWVAEFRDPWVKYLYSTRGPDSLDRVLERIVVRNATKVVWYSTLEMEDDYFNSTYPDQPSRKFLQIPYFGYEEGEFKQIRQMMVYDSSAGPMRIAYVGVFYKGGRSPEHFLRGLAGFVRARQLSGTQLQVTFAGSWGEEYSQLVSDWGLQDIVKYIGFVPRSQCLELYARSHILLLLGARDLRRNFPSKFWDYLGARRVILALVPPDSKLGQCIVRENLGIVVPPTDVEAIREGLATLYDRFTRRELGVSPSSEFLRITSRADSERRFASVLDSVVNQ